MDIAVADITLNESHLKHELIRRGFAPEYDSATPTKELIPILENKLREVLSDEIQRTQLDGSYTWSLIDDPKDSANKPSPRETVACAVYEGNLYIFGGYAYGRRYNSMYKFGIASNDGWTEIIFDNNTEPSKRSWMNTVIHQGKFIVFGGLGERCCYNDIHAFDFKTEKWTTINVKSGTPPTPRYKCDMCVWNNKIYVFGGKNWDENSFNDIYTFDLSSQVWSNITVKGKPPTKSKESCCSQLIHDKAMVVFCKRGKLHKFYFETNTWKQVIMFGSYPKRTPNGCCMLLHNGILMVFDRITDIGATRFHTLHEYDFRAMEWRVVKTTSPPSPRRGASCVIYDNKLYCFGGSTKENKDRDSYKYMDDLHCMRLNIRTNNTSTNLPFQASLFNVEDYSDIIFKFRSGEVLYAHKLILASQSDYFSNMFTSGLVESKDRRLELLIDDVRYEVFFSILQYFYGIPSIRSNIAVELLIAANKYLIMTLRKQCIGFILMFLSTSNVLSVLMVAEEHSIPRLRDACISFIIAGHFNSVINTPDFIELCTSQPLLVQEICRRSNNSNSEEDELSTTTPSISSHEAKRRKIT